MEKNWEARNSMLHLGSLIKFCITGTWGGGEGQRKSSGEAEGWGARAQHRPTKTLDIIIWQD